MEIILLERIEKLGGIGDVVTVKNGFARNYLLPNHKALRANDANRKLFEANRSKIEADNAERRTAAEGHAKDVDGKQVVLIRQASNTGQLYGSVSVRDILDALIEDGATNLTKAMFELERPIKSLGLFDVKVKLHRPVRGVVKQFSVTRQGRRWFVNVICVEVPKQVRPPTGAIVGLDRGITHLAADSDGGFTANPRHLQQSAERLAAAQQELARKKRGSNRRRRFGVPTPRFRHRRWSWWSLWCRCGRLSRIAL